MPGHSSAPTARGSNERIGLTSATLPHVYFDLDTFVLDAAQALCVALPAAGVPACAPAAAAAVAGRSWRPRRWS